MDAKRLRLRGQVANPHLFELYLHELEAARPRLRLTSLTDRNEIERRHFMEPLALLAAIEREGLPRGRVIDIGSGAGFPGLPMKIERPELSLTLLEANERRAAFLHHLLERLGLDGVSVVCGRAEDVARDPAHRETYDLALARAVARLPVLVELALPFLRVGGWLAAPKGSGAPREVREAEAALAALGGSVEAVRPLELPGKDMPPTLVLVRKHSRTPDRFPRRPGIPAKRPLR